MQHTRELQFLLVQLAQTHVVASGIDDLTLDLLHPAREVTLLHGEEVLVDSLERALVNVFAEPELGEQGDLGLAPKMGLDLPEINRLARAEVTFYDRKDRFARAILAKMC